MRIFIVGAGETGAHIASSLVREEHDLVIVERDRDKVEQLQKSMDILAVCGNGCNPSLLKTHGVGRADLFFAVSNDGSANLLAALTARALGARRCVVRVGQSLIDGHPLLEDDPEIVTLNPERLVAEEISGVTRVPGAIKARFFAGERLVLLEVRPSYSAEIYDRPIKELKGPEGWVLTGIHRAEGLTIPRGDTILRRGDMLYAVGRSATIPGFLESVGVDSKPTKRVVIAGAGRVGRSLARRLVDQKIKVCVIQRGARRAFDLAAEVPEALVLRGDARDPELLREAGADEADYFVAATQEDEVNLLSSLLAREMGASKVVALYNQPEFLNLLNAVRIDLPLSPRLVVAGVILRMVHRREIVNLDLVEGGEAEVVEFKVPPKAKVTKRKLKNLRFPRTAVVGAVARGDQVHMPTGDFQFEEGDSALIFTLVEALPALEAIFRGK